MVLSRSPPDHEKEGFAVTKFLLIWAAMASPGLIWIAMGISTLRDCKRMRQRERARAMATVVDLIPETRLSRRSRSPIRQTRTVWHPVLAFSADGRDYRLQSAASLGRDDLPLGGEVEICYDADDPTHFHFEPFREEAARTAKRFIAFSLFWVLVFCPFLIHKSM